MIDRARFEINPEGDLLHRAQLLHQTWETSSTKLHDWLRSHPGFINSTERDCKATSRKSNKYSECGGVNVVEFRPRRIRKPRIQRVEGAKRGDPSSRLANHEDDQGSGEEQGWGLASALELAESSRAGKRPSVQEGSETALRESEELVQAWGREASREPLESSWGRASSRDKDLGESWSSREKEKLEEVENWVQQSQGAPAASDSTVAHNNLDSSSGGREPGSDTGSDRERALEQAARGSARARSAGTQEYSGRRNAAAAAGGSGGSGHNTPMSSGAPCGACKFLRRKCVRGCIFAPYFSAEQGAAKFAAVHKIFGASNVAKLLLHIPTPRRCDAVLTISYEAQARLSDPVYGCVATIFALQQQVAALQQELAIVQAQLTDRSENLHEHHHQQHHHHHQQQQQLQQRMAGFGATANQAVEYMQHLADHSQLSPTSGLSMGMPSGSGAGSYSRVKEEGIGNYLQAGMHHQYDMGMPSSSLQEPLSVASEQSLLESLQKSRTHGGLGPAGQADEGGDLQALASLLRRK